MLDAYPFGSAKGWTREQARSRATERARRLKAGALRALLAADGAGSVVSIPVRRV